MKWVLRTLGQENLHDGCIKGIMKARPKRIDGEYGRINFADSASAGHLVRFAAAPDPSPGISQGELANLLTIPNLKNAIRKVPPN